jgi:hypothetical protein
MANPAVTTLWRPFVLNPHDEGPAENPKKQNSLELFG